MGPDNGATTLREKLKTMGMEDGLALSFHESDDSQKTRCSSNSIGFLNRGPQLSLFLTHFDDKKVNCFGQVIRGQDNLIQMQSLLRNYNKIQITAVTHLRVD